MTAYASLLRAINVAGNNLIKMAALKELHEALGFTSVSTLLQSGNVAFVGRGKPAAVARKIEAQIARRFELEITVTVRSAAELDALMAANPFPEVAAEEPGRLLVMFLAGSAEKGGARRLAEAYSGPERLQLAGQELFLHYPNGVGRSKLTTALIEKHLGVAGTARNWNTVTKLRDLVGGL